LAWKENVKLYVHQKQAKQYYMLHISNKDTIFAASGTNPILDPRSLSTVSKIYFGKSNKKKLISGAQISGAYFLRCSALNLLVITSELFHRGKWQGEVFGMQPASSRAQRLV